MADPTLRGRVTLNTQSFKKGLSRIKVDAQKTGDELKARFKRIGAGIASGIKIGLAGAGVAFASGLAITAAYAKKILNTADEIDKMSQRTGIAVDELHQLGFAAEHAGTNLEQVEDAAKDMQKNITDAANGSKGMSENFDSLGLSAEELAKLKPAEQFSAIAEAIEEIKDPTVKATLAMKIFGEGGRKLIPMFKDLDKQKKEYLRVSGLTAKEMKAEARDAAKLSDSFLDIKVAIEGLFRKIVGFKDMSGFIDSAREKIIQFRESAKFETIVAQFKSFGNTALSVAAGIFNAVVNIDKSFVLLVKSGAKVGLFLGTIIGSVILAAPILKLAMTMLMQSGLIGPLSVGLALVAAMVAAFNFGEILEDAFNISGVLIKVSAGIKAFFAAQVGLIAVGMRAIIDAAKNPFKRGFLERIADDFKETSKKIKDEYDNEVSVATLSEDEGIGFSAAFDKKMAEIEAKMDKLKAAIKEKGKDLADALGLTEAMAALEKLKADFQKGVDDFNKSSSKAGNVNDIDPDNANKKKLGGINRELDKIHSRSQVKFVITGEGLEKLKKKKGGNLTQAQRFTRDNDNRGRFQKAVGDVHKNRGVTSKGFNQVSRVAAGSAGVVSAVAQTGNLEKMAGDRNSLLSSQNEWLAKIAGKQTAGFGEV